MVDVAAVRDRVDGGRARRARRAVVEVAFGDAAGVVVFCVALVFFVLTWRVGQFITDIELFGAMLVHLADGSLALGTVGETGVYPGMHRVGATVYGRNYGQVAASVPVYWFVEALGPARFHWLVVVGWSGLVAAVVVAVGTHFGRRQAGIAVGGTTALLALAANAVTFPRATVFGADSAFVALQVTTMLAAATTSVVLYRLCRRQAGRRVGLLAGVAVAVATPVGVWATLPKRHAFTAALVAVALYALSRSREETASARLGQAGFRAVAYASAGLLAWVHSPEGLTLFLAVALADLPTAPTNDRRTLAVIAAGFALSLVPFLVTNFFVSGNPVRPPRFVEAYNGGDVDLTNNTGDGANSATASDGATGGGEAGGGEAGDGATGGTVLGALDGFLPTSLLTFLQAGFFQYVDGMTTAVDRPERLVTLFVRWGDQGYDPAGVFFGDGTNLSILESAPLVAAVVAGPLRYGIEAVRARRPAGLSLTTPDLFALVCSVLFVALYVPQLPTKLMVTVRYLHPLYPLLVYAAVRQEWLRDAVSSRTRVAVGGYALVVLVGAPLTVGALLAASSVGKGGFMQAFGLVALAAGGSVVASGVADAAGVGDERATALAAGVAAGVGTLLVVLLAMVVMHFGPSALPVVERASGELRFALLRSR